MWAYRASRDKGAESYADMYAPRKSWHRRAGAKKFYMATAASLTGAIILMTSWAGATNLSIGGPSDCDDNAILHCGAHSMNELIGKYDNNAYARVVYKAFGISAADMGSLPSMAVEGRVTKAGDVYAGGRLVARNAMTGGRQYMPGSKQVDVRVNANRKAVFFKRAPSVSFASDSLPAYVSMQNGRFRFAIIASCGNAVSATPVIYKTAVAPARPVSKPKPPRKSTPTPTAPSPTPTPTPTPTPPPTPAPQTQTQNQTQQVNQNVNQTQQVTVENRNETTAPSATPATTTATAPSQPSQPAQQAPATQTVASAPASTVSTLPNTGPGSVGAVAGIFSAASLLGYLGYRRLLLRRFG